MNASSSSMALAESVLNAVLAPLHGARDLADILSMGAEALKRAPLPVSAEDARRLGRADVAHLLPLVGGAACLCTGMCYRSATGYGNSNEPSFQGSRVLILRGLALSFLASFLMAAFQMRAVYGQSGLLPTSSSHGDQNNVSDLELEAVVWLAVFVTFVQLLSPMTSALLPALMWWLHRRLMPLGGADSWYSWQRQLAELGFISIWLCPLMPAWRSPPPHRAEPPPVVMMLLRFQSFQRLLSSGLSKLGVTCWGETQCCRRFQTIPLPSPLSYYAHLLPEHVCSFLEVNVILVEELVVPFLLLAPPRAVRLMGVVIALASLLRTGLLTNSVWSSIVNAVPYLAFVDDALLSLISRRLAPPQTPFECQTSEPAASSASSIDASGGARAQVSQGGSVLREFCQRFDEEDFQGALDLQHQVMRLACACVN